MKKFVLVSFLAIWAVIGQSVPANAHADLVSSYPQAGEQLQQAPKYVQVRFDGNLLNLGKVKVNVLKVKDSSGRTLDDGNSVTTGPYLKVGLLKQSMVGDIFVSWRVTSEDGHPVEGGYKFHIGVSKTLDPTPLVGEKHSNKNFLARHRSSVAYFAFGFLAIGTWAVLSLRIFRRKRKQ
jgi:methionine-rich copper-binding protein CopC